jgi:Protein of unknown function (DUF1569)
MRTLLAAEDRRCVAERIAKLTPDDRRRWGKMKVEEMVCHLIDSYAFALSEKDASEAPTGPTRRKIEKWVALKCPIEWPKGIRTRPELEQGVGGRPPTEFEKDRASLLAIFERFCKTPPKADCPHPTFGVLTPEEWMRWGWLHADHHLRQFGR